MALSCPDRNGEANGVAVGSRLRKRIADFEGLSELPFELEFEGLLDVVIMNRVVVRPDVRERPAVTELKRPLPIRRLRRLLQDQQELGDARLAGAVRSEQDGNRSQADVP